MTVNVKDFGAQGNGITNDTAAIQSAINSLAAKGGGTVFFPEGTYNVSTINLNVRGVKLQGSGWLGTRIQGIIPNVKIVNITADYCGVESTQVNFQGYTPNTTTSIGIYTNANNNTFRDFRMYNTGIGVYFDKGTIGIMDDFYIETFSQAGIYMDRWIDLYVTNFVIQASVGAQYGQMGCWVAKNGCDAILASNGDILSGKYSFYSDGVLNAYAGGAQYGGFTNICFDSSLEQCVKIENSKMLKFTNCWFSGGREGVGFEGMTVGTSQDIRFVNCDFANNGGHGATVKDTAINTKFIGCTFDSNSYTGGVGYYHGLSVWPGTKYFTVDDCTFRNGTFSGKQGFGCLVNYGQSDYYHITNNICQGNTIQGISDGGQGRNKVVTGNF